MSTERQDKIQLPIRVVCYKDERLYGGGVISNTHFSNIREAMSWSTTNQQYVCSIGFLEELVIQGKMIGEYGSGDQTIELAFENQTISFPRASGNKPGIMAGSMPGYPQQIDLMIPVNDSDSPLLNGKFVLLRLTEFSETYFHMLLKRNHGLNTEQLLEKYKDINRAISRYFSDIRRGRIPLREYY